MQEDRQICVLGGCTSKNLNSSVVSLSQLVSPSGALPAELATSCGGVGVWGGGEFKANPVTNYVQKTFPWLEISS